MGDEMGGFHVVGSSCSSIKTIIIVVYAPIFMYQAPRVSWYLIGMGFFPNIRWYKIHIQVVKFVSL
jgi:hypothetical protein